VSVSNYMYIHGANVPNASLPYGDAALSVCLSYWLGWFAGWLAGCPSVGPSVCLLSVSLSIYPLSLFHSPRSVCLSLSMSVSVSVSV